MRYFYHLPRCRALMTSRSACSLTRALDHHRAADRGRAPLESAEDQLRLRGHGRGREASLAEHSELLTEELQRLVGEIALESVFPGRLAIPIKHGAAAMQRSMKQALAGASAVSERSAFNGEVGMRGLLRWLHLLRSSIRLCRSICPAQFGPCST